MSVLICPYCFGCGLIDGDAETAHTCVACQGVGILGRVWMADDEEVVCA